MTTIHALAGYDVAGFSLLWIPISWLAWSLYKCAALRKAAYGDSATEKTFGNIRNEMEITSQFRISFS